MLKTAAYAVFAAFGAFWGTWGAAIPRIREQAALDDAQLGTALLFVSAGALPAMLLTGRALDRWGLRCAAYLLAALGGAGVIAAATGHGLVSLAAGLVLVGMTSGAADVAANSVAGRAEQLTGRPVITRGGGVFSVGVVGASLGTGAAYALGVPVWVPFAAVLLLCVAAGALVHVRLPSGAVAPGRSDNPSPRPPLAPLLLLGALGALGYASENAHQSWSAVFLEDVLSAAAGLSAIAPAAFAAVAAATRFTISALSPAHARTVVIAGAVVAAAGAAVLAAAPSIPVALAGLVLAAAGTATLSPTLFSIVSRNVDESARGRATAIVTVVSYLGFLLGPVYVGYWSSATGLRGAMLAVGALGVTLAALALPLIRMSRYRVR
ncbi:MFS transporter [Paractinoplanes abujensis]|uniref:MFS family permease n=1 Tax=Paractinoplanes abujensis TaxID=882441 RepID=A0A7W7G0B0_9ACTN|nr:MFS transporter [Actinoplanes abujensis]MBB4690955.1 MFS family permease [Actinoplanes abujensis]GID17632.1 MFS transporter [Actinoplanes abujensis]